MFFGTHDKHLCSDKHIKSKGLRKKNIWDQLLAILWLKLSRIKLCSLGEQGGRSGESARIPPMWPGFDSRTWLICGLSSLLDFVFFSGFSGFPPSTKSTLLYSNSIWKQWMKSHFVECHCKFPFYLFFRAKRHEVNNYHRLDNLDLLISFVCGS